MNKMLPVVHFEMPYEDKDRAAEFYKKAFGWKPQMMGPEMGEYVVMQTSEIDQKTMMPKKPGMINGGLWKSKDIKHDKPHVVVSTDNIEESMADVEKAGGKVMGKPMEIPGVGMFVNITDTEGNCVSILQPKGM